MDTSIATNVQETGSTPQPLNVQETGQTLQPASIRAAASTPQPTNAQEAAPTAQPADVQVAALSPQPADGDKVESNFRPADIQKTGLNIVYDPGQGKAEADVIFVHGLQGHPYDTWACQKPPTSAASSQPVSRTPSPNPSGQKKKKKKIAWPSFGRGRSSLDPNPEAVASHESVEASPIIFWPAEVLAKECSDIRVLSWGYDTVVTKGYEAATKNSIFAHARNLLAALEREQVAGRPLVFVAHSLGGIIVKEVLRRSDVSPEDSVQQIMKNTAAVIFMGTPHRGSQSMADLGNDVRRVASMLLRFDSNDKIITALVDGPELELGRTEFRRLWDKHKFRVKTFQEAKALTGVNVGVLNELVVHPNSSSLDDDRERAETIDANHITMCKFFGPKDPGYLQVGGTLKMFIQDIRKKSADRRQHAAHEASRQLQILDEHEKECLRSLSFPEMESRQRLIQAPSQSTCRWVFENRAFSDWVLRRRFESHQGLLWLKGKPGAGKSVLLKTMFRETLYEASSVPNRVVVAHYFSRRGEIIEQNTEGMYRSLWHQIIQQDKILGKNFVSSYRKQRDTHASLPWSSDDLKEKLSVSVLQREGVRFDFFIDGVDECKDFEDVITFFKTLTAAAKNSKANINVCMSSQHYPKVQGDCYLEIIMEDENWPDIYKYANAELPQYTEMDTESRRALAESIANKSQGVFLWATFALRTIKDDHKKDRPVSSTQAELEHLPTELQDLFNKTFETFNDRDTSEALALWQWVLFANAPLSLSSLHEALEPRHVRDADQLDNWREDPKTARAKYERFLQRILNLSKGLLEVIVEVPVDVGPDDNESQTSAEQVDSEGDSQGPLHNSTTAVTIVNGDAIDEALGTVEGLVQDAPETESAEELPYEDVDEELPTSSEGTALENRIAVTIPSGPNTGNVNIQRSELRQSLDPSGPGSSSYRAQFSVNLDFSEGFWSGLGNAFVQTVAALAEDYQALKNVPGAVSYYFPLHIWDSKHPWADDFDLSLSSIANAKVQFIHDSVREFFEAKIAHMGECSRKEAKARGVYFIAEACYSYLHRPVIRSLTIPSQLAIHNRLPVEDHFPLLPYCLDHLVSHCRKAELANSELYFFNNDPCLQILMSCDTRDSWDHRSMVERLKPTETKDYSIFAFLCENELFQTARYYLSSRPEEVQLIDPRGDNLLHRLMSAKIDIVTEALTDLVDDLLRSGIAINSQNLNKETPLFVAVNDRLSSTSTEAKISILLDRGANSAIPDLFGRVPLERLTLFKHSEELTDVLTRHRRLFLSTGLSSVMVARDCDRGAVLFAFESFTDSELEHFIRANPTSSLSLKRATSVQRACLESKRPHFICFLCELPIFVRVLDISSLKHLIHAISNDIAFPNDGVWTARRNKSLGALRRIESGSWWLLGSFYRYL